MRGIKILSQSIGLIGVIGLFVLSIAVTFYSLVEGFQVVEQIATFKSSENKDVAYEAMHVVDLFLLGFTILIASLGLYELFIHPIPSLPEWLRVYDLDQLKDMLVKVTILVMAISFMGKTVKWNGEDNFLFFGIGIAAVIIALSYFLGVRVQMKKKKED